MQRKSEANGTGETLPLTEARLLGFSYDLRITVIRHPTSARMIGIHPSDNIQNGRRPGGNASLAHWLDHFSELHVFYLE